MLRIRDKTCKQCILGITRPKMRKTRIPVDTEIRVLLRVGELPKPLERAFGAATRFLRNRYFRKINPCLFLRNR